VEKGSSDSALCFALFLSTIQDFVAPITADLLQSKVSMDALMPVVWMSGCMDSWVEGCNVRRRIVDVVSNACLLQILLVWASWIVPIKCMI